MKPIILVQARMGSSRLPGKVLVDICGKPMIQHVMERCANAFETVLCLTTLAEDDPLEALARTHRWLFWRSGTEAMGQLHGAAQAIGEGHYIRVTGDCPLIHPALIYWAWKRYIVAPMFTSTSPVEITGFPDGQDIEIFPLGMLTQAFWFAVGKEREHVTPWMQRERLVRRLYAKDYDMTWPPGKWSVDTLEDLERVRNYLRKAA